MASLLFSKGIYETEVTLSSEPKTFICSAKATPPEKQCDDGELSYNNIKTDWITAVQIAGNALQLTPKTVVDEQDGGYFTWTSHNKKAPGKDFSLKIKLKVAANAQYNWYFVNYNDGTDVATGPDRAGKLSSSPFNVTVPSSTNGVKNASAPVIFYESTFGEWDQPSTESSNYSISNLSDGTITLTCGPETLDVDEVFELKPVISTFNHDNNKTGILFTLKDSFIEKYNNCNCQIEDALFTLIVENSNDYSKSWTTYAKVKGKAANLDWIFVGEGNDVEEVYGPKDNSADSPIEISMSSGSIIGESFLVYEQNCNKQFDTAKLNYLLSSDDKITICGKEYNIEDCFEIVQTSSQKKYCGSSKYGFQIKIKDNLVNAYKDCKCDVDAQNASIIITNNKTVGGVQWECYIKIPSKNANLNWFFTNPGSSIFEATGPANNSSTNPKELSMTNGEKVGFVCIFYENNCSKDFDEDINDYKLSSTTSISICENTYNAKDYFYLVSETATFGEQSKQGVQIKMKDDLAKAYVDCTSKIDTQLITFTITNKNDNAKTWTCYAAIPEKAALTPVIPEVKERYLYVYNESTSWPEYVVLAVNSNCHYWAVYKNSNQEDVDYPEALLYELVTDTEYTFTDVVVLVKGQSTYDNKFSPNGTNKTDDSDVKCGYPIGFTITSTPNGTSLSYDGKLSTTTAKHGMSINKEKPTLFSSIYYADQVQSILIGKNESTTTKIPRLFVCGYEVFGTDYDLLHSTGSACMVFIDSNNNYIIGTWGGGNTGYHEFVATSKDSSSVPTEIKSKCTGTELNTSYVNNASKANAFWNRTWSNVWLYKQDNNKLYSLGSLKWSHNYPVTSSYDYTIGNNWNVTSGKDIYIGAANEPTYWAIFYEYVGSAWTEIQRVTTTTRSGSVSCTATLSSYNCYTVKSSSKWVQKETAPNDSDGPIVNNASGTDSPIASNTASGTGDDYATHWYLNYNSPSYYAEFYKWSGTSSTSGEYQFISGSKYTSSSKGAKVSLSTKPSVSDLSDVKVRTDIWGLETTKPNTPIIQSSGGTEYSNTVVSSTPCGTNKYYAVYNNEPDPVYSTNLKLRISTSCNSDYIVTIYKGSGEAHKVGEWNATNIKSSRSADYDDIRDTSGNKLSFSTNYWIKLSAHKGVCPTANYLCTCVEVNGTNYIDTSNGTTINGVPGSNQSTLFQISSSSDTNITVYVQVSGDSGCSCKSDGNVDQGSVTATAKSQGTSSSFTVWDTPLTVTNTTSNTVYIYCINGIEAQNGSKTLTYKGYINSNSTSVITYSSGPLLFYWSNSDTLKNTGDPGLNGLTPTAK